MLQQTVLLEIALDDLEQPHLVGEDAVDPFQVLVLLIDLLHLIFLFVLSELFSSCNLVGLDFGEVDVDLVGLPLFGILLFQYYFIHLSPEFEVFSGEATHLPSLERGELFLLILQSHL